VRREAAVPLVDIPLAAQSDASGPPIAETRAVALDTVERCARRVMEKHCPAYVVVDGNNEIVHFSDQTGRYLGPSPGTASLNLFNLLNRALRPAARTALMAKRPTVREEVVVEINGSLEFVDVIVEPLPKPHEDLRAVAFRGHGKPGVVAAAHLPGSVAPETTRIAELEADLVTTRARLQTTISENETVTEGMKSANEEYQSVNEELQSANEELEASKEEMQSINEELQTVNTELNRKNEVLSRANSDLKNLLDSTEIATIFLDANLCITNFTPATTGLFPLRATDLGRPITEIVGRLSYDDLKGDVERVMRTLATVEREVSVPRDHASFLMRVRPYRTIDNVIDGVVMTFVDITERKRRESELAHLAAVVESSPDAIIGQSPDGTIRTWNTGAASMLGYAAPEAVGHPFTMLLPEERQAEIARLLDGLKHGDRLRHLEADWIRKDRTRVRVSASVSVLRVGDALVISWFAREASARADPLSLDVVVGASPAAAGRATSSA
jgi:two-component system CheB/CheR fusion protein